MRSLMSSLLKGDGGARGAAGSYVSMGVDIGTTSVKVVIVQSHLRPSAAAASDSSASSPSPSPLWSHAVLSFHSSDHLADVPSSFPTHSEQYVTRLLLAIFACVRALPSEHRRRVDYIGVSCAMHGVVLWSDREAPAYLLELMAGSTSSTLHARAPPHSAFIDWRDGRCDAAFLSSLNAGVPPPSPSTPLQSGVWLSSGFGCATLAYLASTQPQLLSSYSRAATIGDYLVWLLMNVRDTPDAHATADRLLSYPAYIHPTNAAAWGMYEQEQQRWQTERTTRAHIPARLLPTVLPTPPLFPISPVWVQWLGVGPTAQVSAAVGDAQASVWAVEPSLQQLILYLGTSAQLSLVVQPALSTALGDAEEEDEQVEGDAKGEEEAERRVEREVKEPSVAASDAAAARVEGQEQWRSSGGQQGRETVDLVVPAPLHTALASSSSASPSPPVAAATTLPSCEYRPYFHGRRLLVCASLTGGNAFEWLARSVQLLHAQLSAPAAPLPPSSPHTYSIDPASCPHPLSFYYQLLLLQGYQHIPVPPSLDFHPTFLPDRWSPSTPPSLTFLSASPSSLSLGSLASSLCLGVVRNLRRSMERSLGEREWRLMAAVDGLLGVGGALRRNGLFRLWAEKEWGRPLLTAQPLSCEWKRSEAGNEREKERKARTSTAGGGGGGGGGGEVRVDVEEDVTSLLGAEAVDISAYHPDAAFGAAILGLDRLVERRTRERKTAEDGRL